MLLVKWLDVFKVHSNQCSFGTQHLPNYESLCLLIHHIFYKEAVDNILTTKVEIYFVKISFIAEKNDQPMTSKTENFVTGRLFLFFEIM